MGPIIIIAVLALLGWLSVSAVRSLLARGVGFPWWAILVSCVIVGFCLGVWFGFFFEYQPSPRLRVIGCPVPVVCFVLETSADGKEQWTDFITPAPLLFAASNVLLWAFVSVYPAWLANTLWRFVGRRGVGRRVAVEPELEVRLKRAAEAAFASAFADRMCSGSEVWAVEGDSMIVAVYQRHIRPSNAPTFFAVTLPDMGATLMTDPLKYRPRGLK